MHNVGGQTRSLHPGGVNVGFGDGSVRFIKNTIANYTWYELLVSTTAGSSARISIERRAATSGAGQSRRRVPRSARIRPRPLSAPRDSRCGEAISSSAFLIAPLTLTGLWR